MNVGFQKAYYSFNLWKFGQSLEILKDKHNAQCYFIIIQRDMSYWANREELPATLACYTFSERSCYADPFSPLEDRGPLLWRSCEFEGPVPGFRIETGNPSTNFRKL